MKETQAAILTINFRLNKYRIKEGRAAIYLRITVDNKRVELFTQQYIEVNLWDQKMQCIIGKTVEGLQVNQELSIVKANLQKHYNRLVAIDKSITAELSFAENYQYPDFRPVNTVD